MTRVAFSQLSRNIVNDVFSNYADVQRYSNQLSSGYKAANPGDSSQSGTIQQFRASLQRLDGYADRTVSVKTSLEYQDDVVSQGIDLLARAKELASQAANEAVSANQRDTISREVWQIRNQLVALANSKYQGNYVWSGANTASQPFNASTYTNSGSADSAQRYVYAATPGSTNSLNVEIADGVSVNANTPGNQVWANVIGAVEHLGRALEGFTTTQTGGLPDGGGVAYNLPTDYPTQTLDLASCITELDSARDNNLLTERVSLGARMAKIETASSMIESTKKSANIALDTLQNADTATAATGLQQAQYALQASLQVTSKILNLSVLDYL